MSDNLRCRTDDSGFYSYLQGTLHFQVPQPNIMPDSQPLSQYPYTFARESYSGKKTVAKDRFR